MTIGILQILLIIFISVFLFGNFKNILKDLKKSISNLKKILKK
jgi:Sec-independent protein translocase protein TatA